MLYEYWTPRGECGKEIASSHTERETIDNLWVKNEHNIQFRHTAFAINKGKLSICTMSYIIVYVNGGPLKGGQMPPPAPQKKPWCGHHKVLSCGSGYSNIASYPALPMFLNVAREKSTLKNVGRAGYKAIVTHFKWLRPS